MVRLYFCWIYNVREAWTASNLVIRHMYLRYTQLTLGSRIFDTCSCAGFFIVSRGSWPVSFATLFREAVNNWYDRFYRFEVWEIVRFIRPLIATFLPRMEYDGSFMELRGRFALLPRGNVGILRFLILGEFLVFVRLFLYCSALLMKSAAVSNCVQCCWIYLVDMFVLIWID